MEAQQFVMFKLAMLPVNGRTPLPRVFPACPEAFTASIAAWIDTKQIKTCPFGWKAGIA